MWTDESVFYQIYPLGALDAPFENDGVLCHRLRKLSQFIPHFKKLGVDCILMNPLFQSHTHGYDTIDYTMVDVRLGTNQDLIDWIDQLHENSIRIVLDAVFNHVGRGFFAFEDVLKNREQSKYKDWFYIDFYNNNKYDDHLSYQDWEGNTNLVRLNLQNPEVVSYIISVVDMWMDVFHVDGLRLDVAYCLDRDFLLQLHDHTKAKNPEFFLLGETLHGDYNQWVNERMLDSCTNYECYKGLYSSFNTKNLFEICHSLNRQFGKDPWCLYTNKMLFNFVDNHDVVRIASRLEDTRCLPLIYTLMFTMPGIPCIYYGSEWGILGEKNWNDTDLRPAIEKMEWNDLTDHIQRLVEIKHVHDALHSGEYEGIYIGNQACIFQRKTQKEVLWTCINMSDSTINLRVNYEGNSIDLLTNTKNLIKNNLILEPFTSKILKLIM